MSNRYAAPDAPRPFFPKRHRRMNGGIIRTIKRWCLGPQSESVKRRKVSHGGILRMKALALDLQSEAFRKYDDTVAAKRGVERKLIWEQSPSSNFKAGGVGHTKPPSLKPGSSHNNRSSLHISRAASPRIENESHESKTRMVSADPSSSATNSQRTGLPKAPRLSVLPNLKSFALNDAYSTTSSNSSSSVSGCYFCKKSESQDHNPLIQCACKRRYHISCHKPTMMQLQMLDKSWRCCMCSGKAKSNPNFETLPNDTRDREEQAMKKRKIAGHDLAITLNPVGQFDGGIPPGPKVVHSERINTTVRVECHESISFSKRTLEIIAKGREQESLAQVEDPTSPSPVLLVPPNAIPSGCESPNTFELLDADVDANEPANNKSKKLVKTASDTDESLYMWPATSSHLPLSFPRNQAKSKIHNVPAFRLRELIRAVNYTGLQLPFKMPVNFWLTRKVHSTARSRCEFGGVDYSTAHPAKSYDSLSPLSIVKMNVATNTHMDVGRPKYSYAQLITAELQLVHPARLTCSAICGAIQERYHFFKHIIPAESLASNISEILHQNSNFEKHLPCSDVQDRQLTWALQTVPPNEIIGRPLSHVSIHKNSIRDTAAESNSNLIAEKRDRGQESPIIIESPKFKAVPVTSSHDYYVSGNMTPDLRILARRNMTPWSGLSSLLEIRHNEELYRTGDIVLVLLENYKESFARISEIRQRRDGFEGVGLFWYRSKQEVARKSLNPTNNSMWPTGYQYMMTNEFEISVINVISRKATTDELHTIFRGPLIVDMSKRARGAKIRPTGDSQVSWAAFEDQRSSMHTGANAEMENIGDDYSPIIEGINESFSRRMKRKVSDGNLDDFKSECGNTSYSAQAGLEGRNALYSPSCQLTQFMSDYIETFETHAGSWFYKNDSLPYKHVEEELGGPVKAFNSIQELLIAHPELGNHSI